MGITVLGIVDKVQTEADAYRFLEELRWPEGQPTCLHCEGTDTYLITPANGVSRKTRTGSESQRRVWRCRGCRKQFSVLTGTMMHGTKVAIRVWCLVLFEMVSSKNGVSAREIERKYAVCPRTAWFLMHRIRNAMQGDALAQTMRGTIEADETYYGGNPQNRPNRVRNAIRPITSNRTDKATILSLVNRDSGEMRSRVVPDVTGHTLRKVIAENVDMAGSTLNTDQGSWYRAIGQEFAEHETVNHSRDEYVRYERGAMVTTNDLEGFFSQLKRSIDGTHHRVSRVHLQRYLDEFDFRYSTRKMSDGTRLARLMSQAEGTRLTYTGTKGHG